MIRGEAISHVFQSDDCTALSTPVSASIAHLNVKGTASVATLAIKSSTTDQATCILRSTRSPGQMYGHRWTSVPIRVARSAELAGGAFVSGEALASGGFLASSAVGNESLSAIEDARNQRRAAGRRCVFFDHVLAVI